MTLVVIELDRLRTMIDDAVTAAVARVTSQITPAPTLKPLASVTATQAAEIMQLSRHTVGKLVRSGTLKLDKTGRITMASVEVAMNGEKE